MRTLLIIASVIIVFIVLHACKHMPPDQPIIPTPGGGGTGGGGTGGGTGSTAICFESQILPLFQSYCAKSGCHDAVSHRDGYILDSYENLFKKDGREERDNIIPGKPESSELYEVLFETGNDKMPPPGNTDLTAEQKNLIATWIREGAKKTVNCSSSCDSTLASYSFATHIRPILQNNCTGCHSGSAPSGSIDLSTHAGVSTVALNGRLYGAISHSPGYSPMPKVPDPLDPSKIKKLPACEIAQIRKWAAAGAPNN
jgi:hypothetical protein